MISDFQKQRYLDLYFEDKARELLPDPEKYPQTVFQGFSVRFGKKEIQRGPKHRKFTTVYQDDIAAIFQVPGEEFGVKVKFRLDRPPAGTERQNIWEAITVVYSHPENAAEAYEALWKLQNT